MDSDLTLISFGKGEVPRLLGLGFVFVAALAAQALSQTILIDDFNDSNADGWTTADTTIGKSWSPSTLDAGSGTYHSEGGGPVPVGQDGGLLSISDQLSTDPTFSNGCLRAKMRVETEGSIATLLLRGSPGNAYLFFGTTHLGGQFLSNKLVNGRIAQTRHLPGNLSFGVNE